jgi:putative nucleotidyltransferase with HDIG domain
MEESMMTESKMKHSNAVAIKMKRLAKEYDCDERAAYTLGLLHDIGYDFDDGYFHESTGADILKEQGYLYWLEVKYHGIVQNKYYSGLLRLLNHADMTTGPEGQDMTYDERAEEIGIRFGFDSVQYGRSIQLVEMLRKDFRGLHPDVFIDSCGYAGGPGCVGIVITQGGKLLTLGTFEIKETSTNKSIERLGIELTLPLIHRALGGKTYVGYTDNIMMTEYDLNFVSAKRAHLNGYFHKGQSIQRVLQNPTACGMWLADKIGRWTFHDVQYEYSEKLEIDYEEEHLDFAEMIDECIHNRDALLKWLKKREA